MTYGYIKSGPEINIIQPLTMPTTGATALVTSVLDDAKSYADEALNRALVAIEELGRFSVVFDPISSAMGAIDTIDLPELDDQPLAPTDIIPVFPAVPDEPALGDVSSTTPPPVVPVPAVAKPVRL